MSSVFLSRFSLHICKTLLIIFQIFCNTSWALNDFSTTPSPNDNVEDDIVSFDGNGPFPIYPGGRDFGKEAINLGGLDVYEALFFKKIWTTQSGGLKAFGATCYEPTSLPKGFKLIGHFCKPNSVDMFVSVLTAKATTQGALKSPIDYTLIWTSKGADITKVEDAYIWLPIPPHGYKAVGHIVTTSPVKPSLDKVWCIRSDFTDLTEVDSWIWGYNSSNIVNLYTTKPKSSARSVPAGTFLAQNGSSTHELACLKMVRRNPYTAMPSNLQIRTLMQAYAPWVYFHPDEEYFPSSTPWFFKNGAVLHQTGRLPAHVKGNGTNLPSNVAPEDAYLDLPDDEDEKERVKKGFLSTAFAYVHVKPALAGTYTDIAIWLYYPFNGGGKLQLGPLVIPLGIIGEHVSDWEHITLRIDNYRGILKNIYLSQHAKGVWARPREFEFMNSTRPVVYASLHGHTHYSTPTYHVHMSGKLEESQIRMLYDEFQKMNNSNKYNIVKGEKFFGFGPRDDTEKSDNVMDIASRYDLVYTDYKNSGEEPWLNYSGRWGPKITYSFAKAVFNIVESLPDKLKELATKALNGLPPELFGEEGPQGPKMRENWTQDERV
ncbi:putative vacuolar protein sorting-associated protein [Helianthus anomalus]